MFLNHLRLVLGARIIATNVWWGVANYPKALFIAPSALSVPADDSIARPMSFIAALKSRLCLCQYTSPSFHRSFLSMRSNGRSFFASREYRRRIYLASMRSRLTCMNTRQRCALSSPASLPQDTHVRGFFVCTNLCAPMS